MPVRTVAPAAARFARGVGWMSVVFGVFDTALAGRMGRGVGFADGTPFRLAGARELATGAAAILRPDSLAPIAARIAGDMADLVTLGTVAARPANPHRGRALAGVAIVVAVLIVDLVAARRLAR